MFEEYKELAKASNWWDSVKSTLAAPGKYLGDATYSSENKALAKPKPTKPLSHEQATLQAWGAGGSGQGNLSVTSTEQFNPDSTTRSGQIAGMQDLYNTSRAMQSSDSDIAAAAYARAQSNPRYKHLLENFDPATASYQIPEQPVAGQYAPGTKIDDNYTVPSQVDNAERARIDKYRAQLPAYNSIQQPVKAGEHKCTCGACANCRANAGSKDNMRVQDKNPKKVPVKDFEITGEEAWKGVPNVKTKVKSAEEATPQAQSPPYSTGQFQTEGPMSDIDSLVPPPKPPAPRSTIGPMFDMFASPQAQNDRRMTIARSATKYDPSLSNYSRQAGQWLSNKMGYGKQFAGLGSTWQALLPALLGAGGLTAGAYGLSHLFGDDDEKRSSANPALLKSALNVTDAIKPTAAVAALGALINLVKDESVLRGAGTGALAGLGGYAGHELGTHLGAGSAINSRPGGPAGDATPQDQHALGLRTGIGGTSGAGLGAYGGYELAQHLWGDEDEKADFRLARKRRKTAGWKAKAIKNKKAKTKASIMNKKAAADLLWCASQLVKQAATPPATTAMHAPNAKAMQAAPNQAAPSPYNQMTPPYLQNAASNAGSGLKNIVQGARSLLTNRGRAKPSALGAFGVANALKGMGDHLGLTTLMSPNPSANMARVGGNLASGLTSYYGSPGGRGVPSVKDLANHSFGQQESPEGWQKLTGLPFNPEQMVNMGDPRLRQLGAQEFKKVLEHGPTAKEVSRRDAAIEQQGNSEG